jgi:hypothetical protein
MDYARKTTDPIILLARIGSGFDFQDDRYSIPNRGTNRDTWLCLQRVKHLSLELKIWIERDYQTANLHRYCFQIHRLTSDFRWVRDPHPAKGIVSLMRNQE